MDEISNGLDSSTTFQLVTCLQQLTHITGFTILVSLLQPTPETFDLFDDIILIAEGKTIYHGPRINILEFFEKCGFRCPPRKVTSSKKYARSNSNPNANNSNLYFSNWYHLEHLFLQVVSDKDQAQYWHHEDKHSIYVSPKEFGRKFKEFHVGKKLDDDLSSLMIKLCFVIVLCHLRLHGSYSRHAWLENGFLWSVTHLFMHSNLYRSGYL